MDPNLLERLLKSPRLPSLPTVAIEILELINSEDVDIRTIAQSISHDVGLSGKLLRMVNSSYYGQRRQISTISDALVVLGLNGIKTLALGFSLVGKLSSESDQAFDHIRFWRRSVFTAVASRSLAKRFGLVEQEEAFIAGLMQDIGVLAMSQVLAETYPQTVQQSEGDHARLLALEQQQYRLDHSQVGAALAERWNLPRILSEPIRFHARPDDGPEDLKPLIRCVALAGDVADLFIDALSSQSILCCQADMERWFGIPPERCEHLLASIHHETIAVARWFELPVDIEPAEVILARANEAMLEISLKQQQESEVMRRQNQHLAQQLVTDSLTGVANRRGLDEFVAQQFIQCRDSGSALSMLFLDVDNFKGINDNHGHHVGDHALITLTKTIQQVVTGPSRLARFGGDEFAVVLAGADQQVAQRLAESVRQRIESTRIDSDEAESPVSMTVSIGVATYQDHNFANEKQLFLAADQALYAAKAGGRNRVRVFTAVPACGPGRQAKAS